MKATLAERFEGMVCPEPNTGCHLWTGCLNEWGYGKFRVSSEHVASAHRVAFFLRHGRWPLNALHRCDQPCCVNPDHLFEGTIADNNRDMADKGRHGMALKTHCAQGHEYAGRNLRARGGGRWRDCRECRNDSQRRYQARKRSVAQ